MTLSDKLMAMSDKLNDVANSMRENKAVMCPRCKSTTFSVVPKRVSIIALGVKSEAVCHNCGKHFKI